MTPTSHPGVSGMTSDIHVVMVGSRKARDTLAMIRAPEQQAMNGSMNRRHIGVPEKSEDEDRQDYCRRNLELFGQLNQFPDGEG